MYVNMFVLSVFVHQVVRDEFSFCPCKKNGIHVLKQHFCQIHQQYDGYILGLWLFKWFLFDEPLEFGYVPSIFQRQAVQQPAALFMNLGKFRLVKYDNLPR